MTEFAEATVREALKMLWTNVDSWLGQGLIVNKDGEPIGCHMNLVQTNINTIEGTGYATDPQPAKDAEFTFAVITSTGSRRPWDVFQMKDEILAETEISLKAWRTLSAQSQAEWRQAVSAALSTLYDSLEWVNEAFLDETENWLEVKLYAIDRIEPID